MNNLEIQSCKHENNSINFTNIWWKIFVSWKWIDPWKSRFVNIENVNLDEVKLNINIWNDWDITISIDNNREYINAVIWNPKGNSWESKNNFESYRIFNIWLEDFSKFRNELLSIIKRVCKKLCK
jgi:hypothetical protein